MRSIEELRNELLRSFKLRSFDLDIGDQRLQITTAEDIEQLVDQISDDEFRKDEQLPYWADVWHSAVALGQYLLAHPSRVHEKDVLEIGCGLGIPGIICSKLGASVTFADNSAHALIAAECNVRQNTPHTPTRFLQLDIREQTHRKWEMIIAADIVYEKRMILPLTNFLCHTLSTNGTAILAEPNRLIAVPFFESIQRAGFQYLKESIPAFLHGRIVDVSIYTITNHSTITAF